MGVSATEKSRAVFDSLSEPGPAPEIAALELADLLGVGKRQVDVVEPLQHLLFAHRVDIELEGFAARQIKPLTRKVHGQSKSLVPFDEIEQTIHLTSFQNNR